MASNVSLCLEVALLLSSSSLLMFRSVVGHLPLQSSVFSLSFIWLQHTTLHPRTHSHTHSLCHTQMHVRTHTHMHAEPHARTPRCITRPRVGKKSLTPAERQFFLSRTNNARVAAILTRTPSQHQDPGGWVDGSGQSCTTL